jgi:hypothetical protein
MIDIGKTIYEERNFFFNEIEVWRIIVNPEKAGYPPIFMLCHGGFGTRDSHYIIALTYKELNGLLTHHISNGQRISISLQLANAINSEEPYREINLDKLLGDPITISGIDLTTRVECYDTGCWEEIPLYFFRFTELKAG